MKTKYLIFSFIISFVLTTIASNGINRLEMHLMEKSSHFDVAQNKIYVELNSKFKVINNDSTRKAFYADLDIVNKNIKELQKDWYSENIIIIILLGIFSVVLFIILNISILCFKYIDTYNLRTIIITALKNKVYLILIIIFCVLFFIHSSGFWFFLL